MRDALFAIVAVVFAVVALVGREGPSAEPRPAAAAAEAGAGEPRVWRDVAYAAIDGVDPNLLSLDIHAPAGASREAPRPVVLFVHGGGWHLGDKATFAHDAKSSWLPAAGYVYVTINYRLSPAARHPDHVRDVAAAVAWTQRHIGDYGGDGGNVVVMGHSAGAHLAALVALHGRYLREAGGEPSGVRGVVLLDGAGYDLPSYRRVAQPKIGEWLDAAFGTDPASLRDASPTLQAGAAEPIPPFLIAYLPERVLASAHQSRKLAGAIERAGGEAELFPADGESHASINRDLGTDGHAPTAGVAAFLARVTRAAGGGE